MPTGSFAPDSPSRIVPVLPEISRSPSTENITAGSVGAIAAPSRPEVTQASPNAQCANAATRPAVANVPSTPSEAIGRREGRRRRQPIDEPPSNRITIRATVAIRSTVWIERTREGQRSEARAAATRKSAADGIDVRALSFDASNAADSAPETTRMVRPKLVRSCTRTTV